ncbi:MAG: GMP/IMP nucleotidase [Gammaproteobacteria bacterium]|nr:GMP/IMP nucleotidase [Gammaproteobacteria bacterium]
MSEFEWLASSSQSIAIDWSQIETVLLDMDGTLLDLHFDNYFWQEYLPQRYAEIKSVDPKLARLNIQQQTQSIRGTLNWYCTDYWSKTLDVDVVELKHEVSHKVATRPYCVDFLDALRVADKDVVMVTNAHHDSLSLKMEKTGIADKFDRLITVHEFALPKEDPGCWLEVHNRHAFDPQKTLLIDDNQQALQSAQCYGIANLLAIFKPDSRAPAQEVTKFPAIHSFDEIMPVESSRARAK